MPQHPRVMLSVVVPAYDEALRLPRTLTAMRGYLDEAGEEYEVIVVDDGSTDHTVEVVQKAALDWPQLKLERLAQNSGKGAATRAGMLAASGDLRLLSDADLATPMEELAHLRAAIAGRRQVAIGSRAMPDTEILVHQPWRREAMGRVYNTLLRLLVLPGLRDTQCGFKLFTGEAAVACFEPLRTMRFGFDAEVLVRARRQGYEIVEVPVRWRHVEASRVSALRDGLRTLWDLMLLRIRGV
jgi:dolichyl-phosphate beta-glucosyltransferase